jgi:hypothetical protein
LGSQPVAQEAAIPQEGEQSRSLAKTSLQEQAPLEAPKKEEGKIDPPKAEKALIKSNK